LVVTTLFSTWAWRVALGLAIAINLGMAVTGAFALTDEFLVSKYGTGTYWFYVAMGVITLVAAAGRFRRGMRSEVSPLEVLVFCGATFYGLFFFVMWAILDGWFA
jgi:hypothetical protein